MGGPGPRGHARVRCGGSACSSVHSVPCLLSQASLLSRGKVRETLPSAATAEPFGLNSTWGRPRPSRGEAHVQTLGAQGTPVGRCLVAPIHAGRGRARLPGSITSGLPWRGWQTVPKCGGGTVAGQSLARVLRGPAMTGCTVGSSHRLPCGLGWGPLHPLRNSQLWAHAQGPCCTPGGRVLVPQGSSVPQATSLLRPCTA